jgi:acyl-CoA synthetase (AMP-forming)/AMP-acid ligase II
MTSDSPPLLDVGNADQLIERAGTLTVYECFREQAERQPEALAIEMGDQRLSYGALFDRVGKVSNMLARLGVGRGDRIAVVSQNRPEYIEVFMAAARIGAIVACQNWRLTVPELQYCMDLVSPTLVVASDRFTPVMDQLQLGDLQVVCFDTDYGALLNGETDEAPDTAVAPEDGLLLLYTSGTTGMPKAALISHRAEIARMMVLRLDLGIDGKDAYLAWSPMFHMGGTEHSLAALMMGGSVVITDGLDVDAMANAISAHRLGWLLLVPATIDPLLARLRDAGTIAKGVKVVGCMADLVPTETIVEISAQLDAPFFNSFGSTETGLPPASGHLLRAGSDLANLGKRQSSLCAFRLLGPDGAEVTQGETGEGAVRGPTLFSGYWGAPETNTEDFRDGWFHMGDLFQQQADGSYDFVGRAKYLIKSGGENIYPAEIERVLLADPRVEDAAVVRQPDDRWGEVPVAVIARKSSDLTKEAVAEMCRRQLAGYKQPKEIHFIEMEEFQRSSTGKIIREDVEDWLVARRG